MKRLRIAHEDGIALVMALGVMMVLTIVLVSVMSYASSSARHASYSTAGQKAYAFAEAGLNNALSQLVTHYYDGNGKPINTSSGYDTSWGITGSLQSPSSSTGCTSTSSCVSWRVLSWTPVTDPYSIVRGTLVLEGTGKMPNPTGGTRLTRTVRTSIDVRRPPQLVATPDFWKEIYSGKPPSSGCDLTFDQSVAITAPLYVAGNLCLKSSASVTSSRANVTVLGWVWMQNSAAIGCQVSGSSCPLNRVATAKIAKECSVASGNNAPSGTGAQCTINSSLDNKGRGIWVSSPQTTPYQTPLPIAPIPLPTLDWAEKAAQSANPTCTTGSLSANPFNLTPAYSYTCTTDSGSIKFTYGSPTSTLQITGNVYFPGDITTPNNVVVKYVGIGSLFSAGSVTFGNNTHLCVKVVSGTCDFDNATNSSSSGYWDPTQAVMLIHAKGAINGQQVYFQGGLYSETSINLGGGTSQTQGPLVTPQILSPGQKLDTSFPDFPDVISGTLGTPPPPYLLGTPYGSTS